MKWTRNPPEPPSKGCESDWYWFHGDNDKQPVVTELWPERGWFRDGWWGEQINKPIKKPEGK